MVDIQELAILFQRRYNIFREIKASTEELAEALSRNDAVSMELVLEIRGDHLESCEKNWEEITLIGEESPENAEILHRLVFCLPEEMQLRNRTEEKIRDIRMKIAELLKAIQDTDEILSAKAERMRREYRN